MVTVWEAVFHMFGAIVKIKHIKQCSLDLFTISENIWKTAQTAILRRIKKIFFQTYIPHFINSFSQAWQTVWQAGSCEGQAIKVNMHQIYCTSFQQNTEIICQITIKDRDTCHISLIAEIRRKCVVFQIISYCLWGQVKSRRPLRLLPRL